MKNTKAFTLIELLVVVLIIGILAAVALPQYQKTVEKARAAEALMLVKAIATANKTYYLANGEYATDIETLDIEVPGEVTTHHSAPRRKTNLFNYAAAGDYVANSIAVANRNPLGSYYFLIAYDDDTICCYGYTAAGEEVCKTLSNGRTGAHPIGTMTCYQIS